MSKSKFNLRSSILQQPLNLKRKVNNKDSLPSFQIQLQLLLLSLYRLPQICEVFSSLELPTKWDAKIWAEEIDSLEQMKDLQDTNVTSNHSDYLVDLYHFKEICRLFSLSDIKTLKTEFSLLDDQETGLNLEEFVLLILKMIRVDEPVHIPFLINGIQQLYKVITKKYKRTKVSFDNFLNYYVVGQLITSSYDNNENDYIQMDQQGDQERNSEHMSALRQFEELKKSKYGFFSSKTQDVVHHDFSIKSCQFAEDQKFIFSLDEQSDYFRVYDSNNLHLLRKIQTDSPKHRFKPIRLIDIYWSDSQKTLGACCQDRSISFWLSNLKSEYCYSCSKFGIQIKIYFIEITQSWITVNQDNQIIEWRFINSLDSGEVLLEKVKATIKKHNKIKMENVQPEETYTESMNGGSTFTHNQVAEGKAWGFKSGAKISFIKEIPSIKKLLIATFDHKITVWNPHSNSIFVTIDIPDGFSSAHTVAFSQKMNLIFSAGFDQSLLIWALDEVNQDYNKIGKIEVSEDGVSVSAIDCFDEYGLLVTIDEGGIIRCWDIEKWRMVYRINVGCKIKNTVSSIIRLEMGRFIIVTSRLHMFEFPVKHARKIKSKFQPLKQMMFNPIKNQLTVASQKELFCFNINNAIVEQKFNIENSTIVPQMNWFVDSILQSNLYTIDKNGLMIWLDHKGDKSNDFTQEFKFYKQIEQQDIPHHTNFDKRMVQDSTSIKLFENSKICGLNYHWSYDMICVWTSSSVKIYKGIYLAAATTIQGDQNLNQSQHTFQLVRQISLQDSKAEVCVTRCLPERDVVGILIKGGIIIFRSFNDLKKLGSLALSKETEAQKRKSQVISNPILLIQDPQQFLELLDFHFVSEFNALIVFDSQLNLWFFEVKDNYKSFECIIKVMSNSLFGDNVLYKNVSQYYYDQINMHQQHHPVVQKIINTFIETQQHAQNIKFHEDLLKANKDPFYNDEKSYSVLYKLKELEKEKRFIQQKFAQHEKTTRPKSLKEIFRSTVNQIIAILQDSKKNGKIFITQPSPKKELLLITKDSIQSTFSYDSSEQDREVPSNARILNKQRTKNYETQNDPPESQVQQGFSLLFILEDFSASTFLSLTNPRGQIMILGLQDLLEQNFKKCDSQYANKQIQCKTQVSVLKQEIRQITEQSRGQTINIKMICDSHSLLKSSGIRILQFNAHDKSHIIDTQMVTFNDKLYLFSFGSEDNLLKAWDVSTLRPQMRIDVDPIYLKTKSRQVRVLQKLHDLQSNQESQDITNEVIDLKMQISALVIEIRGLLIVHKLPTIDEDVGATLLQGEYILPIETKIRWKLKESNPQYRIDQMNETITLLHKMLFRWQQANKHQERVLQLQIHSQQQQYAQENDKSKPLKRPLIISPLILKNPNYKGKSKFFFQKPNVAELDQQMMRSSHLNISIDRDLQRGRSNVSLDPYRKGTSNQLEDSKINIRVKSLVQRAQRESYSQNRRMNKLPGLDSSQQSNDVSMIHDIRSKQKTLTSQTSNHRTSKHNGLSPPQSIAEVVEDKLKTFHNKTVDLNKKFNEIYYPSHEKPVILTQRDQKKKRGKYDMELQRIEEVFGSQPSKQREMKYLMNNLINEGEKKQNRSSKVEMNLNVSGDDEISKTIKTYYLNYFNQYSTKNDEYFSNMNVPGQTFMNKMDQLLNLSNRNLKNPNLNPPNNLAPISDRQRTNFKHKQFSKMEESDKSF